MNSIIIKGRLSREPELRTTSDGKEVLNFSVAVSRRFSGEKDTADFFDCVAWGKTGVFVNTYFHKGQEIIAQGEMHRRKWQDKDGNNRYSWEMNVNQVEFCGSKQEQVQTEGVPNEPAGNVDGFIPVDSEELPF